jgi:nucleoid-associated protein YgaU
VTGKMERAFFALWEPDSEGQKRGAQRDVIHFGFNPKEFTLQRTANWIQKPDKKASLPQYTGSPPASVTLDMYLDASEGGDVSKDVDKLFKCVDPHPKTVNDKPSPPFASFGWGRQTYLDLCVIKTVSVKYTRFRSDGAPIRAVATVTLDELRPEPPRQNPTSGTVDAHTERSLRAGDSLASIAYEELGSPTLWRAIAAVNGIDDPVRIRAGRRLLVPTLTAASASNANGS